jgi:hypothetical protein
MRIKEKIPFHYEDVRFAIISNAMKKIGIGHIRILL